MGENFKPLTEQQIHETIRKIAQDRYDQDVELSKNPRFFGPEGPQPITFETGPWGKNGPTFTCPYGSKDSKPRQDDQTDNAASNDLRDSDKKWSLKYMDMNVILYLVEMNNIIVVPKEKLKRI